MSEQSLTPADVPAKADVVRDLELALDTTDGAVGAAMKAFHVPAEKDTDDLVKVRLRLSLLEGKFVSLRMALRAVAATTSSGIPGQADEAGAGDVVRDLELALDTLDGAVTAARTVFDAPVEEDTDDLFKFRMQLFYVENEAASLRELLQVAATAVHS